MSALSLFALGEHLVELMLAEHRTQCRLRKLARCHHEVFHLYDCFVRIDDPKIITAFTFTRTLSREITSWLGTSSGCAQVHADELLINGMRMIKPGPFTPRSARREDDGALIPRIILTAEKRPRATGS